jgi:hypothetical protein
VQKIEVGALGPWEYLAPLMETFDLNNPFVRRKEMLAEPLARVAEHLVRETELLGREAELLGRGAELLARLVVQKTPGVEKYLLEEGLEIVFPFLRPVVSPKVPASFHGAHVLLNHCSMDEALANHVNYVLMV